MRPAVAVELASLDKLLFAYFALKVLLAGVYEEMFAQGGQRRQLLLALGTVPAHTLLVHDVYVRLHVALEWERFVAQIADVRAFDYMRPAMNLNKTSLIVVLGVLVFFTASLFL